MKRVLVLIPVLLLFVQCAFAQISTYPWTEDFESNSFETNGWTTSIISGSAEWIISTGSSGGSLSEAYSGSYNARISNGAYSGDTAVLLSPVFARPSNVDTLDLSFFYANPLWSPDYDFLIVKLVNGTNETELVSIEESHENWVEMNLRLPAEDLPGNFQIKFVGIPKYGRGFLLDDIELNWVEHTETPVVVDTYPWNDDFESGSFDTKGWTTNILSGNADWIIETGGYGNNCPLTSAYSGSYNARITNDSQEGDTAVLLSPIFVRPSNMDTLNLSFFYANPQWSGDFDNLVVKLVNGDNETELLRIEESHDNWLEMNLQLLAEDLPSRFQIKFIGIPKYGYGFLLDDVELNWIEHVEAPVIVDTYPWREDFESASFETNGWTASILSGSVNWTVGTGSDGGAPSTAHGGTYCAKISNITHNADTAMLRSPVFVRPADIDSIELSFFYANPSWGGDYDRLIVKLINGTNGTELARIEDSHSEWTKMRICIPVSDLQENFQIAFLGMPSYGYGFLLDDIVLRKFVQVINYEETDTYRQVGLGEELGTFPVNTNYSYGYSQQIFLSSEMGSEKNIYTLSFNYSGNENEEVRRFVKVYMGHTQKNEITSDSDFVQTAMLTKVFSGYMTIPAEASWVTIVLDEPFAYNGTDNLVLTVCDITGSSVPQRTFYCSETTVTENVSRYESYSFDFYSDYMSGSRYDIRSNVRFGTEYVEPSEPEIDVVDTDSYRQVGTDVTNAREVLPIKTSVNWSYSQQIFTSAEMGGAHTIYSLSFNYLENTNGDVSRNVKVYLAHTTKVDFDNPAGDAIDIREMTKVYSGRMAFDAESGWITLVLDTPFQYNGNDNLVVAVVDWTDAYTGSPILFACTDIAKTSSVFFASYSSYINNLSFASDRESYNYRSNIRFGFEYVAPEEPVIDTVETDAYLQVGTGTTNTSNILPIETDISWSYSQQIFTAEEMGGSRTIYSVAFNYSGNTSYGLTRNVKAFFAHTQKDEFEYSTGDFVDVEDLTKVYSGNVSFDEESGWITLVFDTPFVYNGTDNLVVAVVDNTGDEASSISFGCSDITRSRAVAIAEYYSGSISSTSEASQKALCYYRNNIRFGLEYIEPPAHIVDTIETDAYLQVGTGTETTDLPFNTFYDYSYSQQLFASWEMGGPRTIYSVSFNYSSNNNSEAFYRDLKLYMGHTSKYEYDYSSDWVKSNLANVGSENVLIDGESGWITIVLRTPFEYNGTDNLAVAVRDNTGEYEEESVGFMCSESEYSSAIYRYTDGNAIYNLNSSFGSVLNKRNNIRFGLEYVEPPVYEVDTLVTDSYYQVGTGISNREALPINTSDKYSYSQQIFNSAEMGEAKTIYSLSLNCVTNDNAEALRNVRIYMGNVSTFEFEYNDWVDVLNLEVDSRNETVSQVYSGELIIPSSSSWVTIILDQPFEYDGTSNLVLAWLDNTGTAQTLKRFACSESELGNSIIAVSNINPIDLEHLDRLSGRVLQTRNNIRFGTENHTVYSLEVSSDDEVMGSVSGSGRYEEGSIVDIRATAHPCFRFEKWSDGETANPRQITMTEDIVLTASFKSIDSDTLNYDNGIYNVSLGYRQQNVEWGILLLPQHLESRPHLTDVLFFVDGEYSYGDYKLSVYQGTDTLPSEKILEDSITVEQYASGWLNFGFDTLDIDTELPLWIILSCEAEYPAVASVFKGEGYENGAWWNPNGTWTQQNYGAWMIKAVLPLDEDDGDDNAVDMISAETIGVYPNPVSSQLYITGVVNGETIEIYSIVGTMVATFTYNGDAVDVENLPAGMYMIRSNGSIVKFVKE